MVDFRASPLRLQLQMCLAPIRLSVALRFPTHQSGFVDDSRSVRIPCRCAPANIKFFIADSVAIRIGSKTCDHRPGAKMLLPGRENAWLAENSDKRKREMEQHIAMNVHANG